MFRLSVLQVRANVWKSPYLRLLWTIWWGRLGMRNKKSLFAVLLVLFLAGVAFAQTWYTANQATVEWDAVTVPADSTVEYVVYLANAITDPGKTNPTEVATTTNTSQLITLGTEGSYFVGVKSRRLLTADGSNVGESDISWSDDPTRVLGGATFGLRYFLPPDAPINMRPV